MKSNPSYLISSHPVYFFVVTLLAGCIITLAGCSNQAGIEWKSTPEDGAKAGEVMELMFEVSRDIINPYNSDEIEITFNVWQENGDTLAVPAFFFIPYSSNSNNLKQNGEPVWKVRFTPKVAGEYFYSLSIDHQGERAETATQSFNVNENTFKGFIQAKHGDRFFRFSTGEVFFPSGINLAHPPHTGGPLDYNYFFQKMEENNMNFMRIWLTPQWGEYAIALEWTDNQYPSQKGNLGLRKINSEMAFRLDSIMESAKEHGIYVMLCLLDERELEPGSHWKKNPYNTEAGGVISEPMQFFSDEEAKNAFRNRLRYLIARYSAYPNLFAWEFWNEFDHHRLIPDWESQREHVGKWHHEMSRYIKASDPHQHMVTTSVVGSRTDRLIWDYPEIDFVQAHSYVGKDHLAERCDDLYQLFLREYPEKPFLISEMGTDWRGFNSLNDAEKVGLHNGLWGSTMGGNSGTAMWWWWLEMDEADLWDEWKNLAAFTNGINWTECINDSIVTDNHDLKGKSLISDGTAWVWCYNRLHNWMNTKNANSVKPLKEVTLKLEHIPPGKYQLLWFIKGRFNEGQIVHANGAVEIKLPEIKSDLAFKLVPVK